MTGPELALRHRILRAFAETGAPPPLTASQEPLLEALQDAHVVVLDAAGAIRMAHPFADHREGASVTAGGRTWWGNCAWDAFGIAAAVGLGDDARVDDHGVAGEPPAVFHVQVPAARWWDDIGFT